MRNLLLAYLIIFSNVIFASETITVTGIKPLPAKVVESTTVNNISYNIHNNSSTNSYVISFLELNIEGISSTTTCGTLAAGADCTLSLVFHAAALSSGEVSRPYIHPFNIKGAPSLTLVILQSTIVKAEPNIMPSIDISLNESGVTASGNTYDLTLTGDHGNNYNCPTMNFGVNNFCSSIEPGEYAVSVTPASVTGSDASTYDAPSTFNDHLTTDGQSVKVIYTENQDVSVQTDITAPNHSGGTIAVEMKGESVDVTHDQTVGTDSYQDLKPGKYTVTAATYVGTDGKTHVPQITNPVTIASGTPTVTITYVAQEPTQQHVKTNITASGLASGKTVHVSCTDGGANTYAHDQASGDTTFATMEDASYTCTSSDFSVGQDTYVAALTNPYIINSSNTEIAISYHKKATGGNYDWQSDHLEALKDANVFLIQWGGGSTTSVINGSTWPPFNPWLVSKVNDYENGTPTTLGPNASVQGFPAYIAMGTVSEPGESVNTSLESLKMDSTFHYVGNGSGDRGCYVDGPTAQDPACSETDGDNPNLAYDPLVDAMASQASAVKTATGHETIAGIVFYTIDMSDGGYEITQDLLDDNLTKHFYNLAYEAIKMQDKITAGTKMILFLNPDSVWPFQNCTQWNCPIMWKPGISQDTTDKVVALTNLKADLDTAIDRLATNGLITSEQATTFKSNLDSQGVLTPPAASKRTVPGLPEYILAQNWMLKTVAPTLPFGWGLNVYDTSNPILNPTGKTQPWQTGSAFWIHKVNHLGMSTQDVSSAINTDATMLANYLKDMNIVGNSSGNYKPDFIFFDKYERDPITSQIGAGWAWNGVDWDSYLEYIQDIDVLVSNLPISLFQIPGSTIQKSGATYTGNLAATAPMWVFGSATKNDFSDWDSSQKTADNMAWTATMNTTVYYTKNSNVSDLEDYLKLSAGAP